MSEPLPQVSEREALRPCPFCDGTAAMRKAHDPDGPNDGGYHVECGKCGASTNLRFSCGEDARPLLIEQWNRRAALPAQDAAERALRAIRSHWREFGPEHGFDEALERSAAFLDTALSASGARPAQDAAEPVAHLYYDTFAGRGSGALKISQIDPPDIRSFPVYRLAAIKEPAPASGAPEPVQASSCHAPALDGEAGTRDAAPGIRPKRIERGSVEHMAMLGAPWHFNMLRGHEFRDVMAFGQACYAAGTKAAEVPRDQQAPSASSGQSETNADSAARGGE